MQKIIPFLFLSCFVILNAQPSFTEADLPAVGYEGQFVSDTSSQIIVDIGKTGGPRTWDFSKPVFGDTSIFEVLSPDSTDWDTIFTKAEFVYHTTGSLGDTTSGDMWEYLRTTMTQVRLLGGAAMYDTLTLIGRCNPEETYLPLPLEMGSSWGDSIYLADTLSLDPAPLVLEVIRIESNKVDAWGTVTVPQGTYEALRIQVFDTTYISLTLATMPFMADTSMTINYQWVAKDVGGVMTIGSYDGETDPEYQEASMYRPLVKNNINTAVEENQVITTGSIAVAGNKIFFEAATPGFVELTIYNIAGQSLGTIYKGTPSDGKTTVELPKGLSKGVYFIKMRSNNENLTAKAVVID